MKKQVWKFEVIGNNLPINMPKGADILTIQEQKEKCFIWALVDPQNELEERFFELYGTGVDIPCDMGIDRYYINTVQFDGGDLVFHLFERLS